MQEGAKQDNWTTRELGPTLWLSVLILERDSDWSRLGQVSTHDSISYDQKGGICRIPLLKVVGKAVPRERGFHITVLLGLRR